MAFIKQSLMALVALSLFAPLGGQEGCEDGSDPIDPCITEPDAPECQGDRTPPPPPEPTPMPTPWADPEACAEHCDAVSDDAYRDCLYQGGSPEACKERGNTIEAECLEMQCGHEPEPPTGQTPSPRPHHTPTPGGVNPTPTPDSQHCDTPCEESADGAYQDCMAQGGSSEMCEAHRASELERCQESCGTEEPEEPSWETKCYFVAQQEWEGCISYGTDPRECDALYASSLDTCLGQAAQAEDCYTGCGASAQEESAACMEETGNAAECQSTYNDTYTHCASHCQVPDSCDSICGRDAPIGCHDPFYCGQNVRAEASSSSYYEVCVAGCFDFEIPPDGGPIPPDGTPSGGGEGDPGEGGPEAEETPTGDGGGEPTPSGPEEDDTPVPLPGN